MRFYIATAFKNQVQHQALITALTGFGHEITYDWVEALNGEEEGTLSTEKLEELSIIEFNGVAQADYVVVLLPGGRGTHTELGIALATEAIGKVFIWGADEYAFTLSEKNMPPFYCDEKVERLICPFELLPTMIRLWSEAP